MLSTVVTQGTATRAQIPDTFVAGKTGTTENYGDAWFVGWTDKITVAVWVGYPDELRPMETEFNGQPVAGGTYPAAIWKSFVEQALELQGVRDRGGRRTTTRRRSRRRRPRPRRPARRRRRRPRPSRTRRRRAAGGGGTEPPADTAPEQDAPAPDPPAAGQDQPPAPPPAQQAPPSGGTAPPAQ